MKTKTSKTTKASRTKEALKTGLKLAIGLGVVAYVLDKKLIDFRAVESVLFDPMNMAMAMVFLFFTSFLVTVRWHLLAQTQGLGLNTWAMFQLTMIGNFFNTFMPGSVGGDVIKAWYIAGREPQRKTKAILTVIVDRVLGLGIFILYAAVTMIFYFPTETSTTEMWWLAASVWTLTSGGIIFGCLYFSTRGRKLLPFLPQIRQKLDSLDATRKLMEAGRMYRNQRSRVLLAALVSAVSFTTMILFFKFEGNMLGIDMGLGQYFFVIPLAMVASAIPLLPGGIGVGQVAFFTLFQWVGYPTPDQGGALCTLFQIYTILFNCLGAFFYIRFRRKPQEAKTSSGNYRVDVRRTSAHLV